MACVRSIAPLLLCKSRIHFVLEIHVDNERRAGTVMALRLLQSSRGMKTLASGAYKKTPESAQKVMDTFAKYKACAVLRTPKAEQCAPAMQAAIDGGFDIVEFTLTTPGCLDQVANFRKKLDGKVMVGCGTVMDIPDAKATSEP